MNAVTYLDIFCELNLVADGLSKKSIGLVEGLLHFEEVKENVLLSKGSISMYWK